MSEAQLVHTYSCTKVVLHLMDTLNSHGHPRISLVHGHLFTSWAPHLPCGRDIRHRSTRTSPVSPAPSPVTPSIRELGVACAGERG